MSFISKKSKIVPSFVKKNNQHKFDRFRLKYNTFSYERFDYKINPDHISIKYTFKLSNRYTFSPELTIHKNRLLDYLPSKEEMDNLVFQIGMIELISYWKAACPPVIEIKPFHLDKEQIEFWKKVYYHGLGEFFYLNGIKANEEDFVDIKSSVASKTELIKLKPDKNSVIVPVGGGKDSVVSLELLKNNLSQKNI